MKPFLKIIKTVQDAKAIHPNMDKYGDIRSIQAPFSLNEMCMLNEIGASDWSACSYVLSGHI